MLPSIRQLYREEEDEEDEEPPKKKRRRQALSCTGAPAPLLTPFGTTS